MLALNKLEPCKQERFNKVKNAAALSYNFVPSSLDLGKKSDEMVNKWRVRLASMSNCARERRGETAEGKPHLGRRK